MSDYNAVSVFTVDYQVMSQSERKVKGWLQSRFGPEDDKWLVSKHLLAHIVVFQVRFKTPSTKSLFELQFSSTFQSWFDNLDHAFCHEVLDQA